MLDLRVREGYHIGEMEKPLLTPRQCELMLMVAQGLTYKEIAVKIHRSESTIKNHMANLLHRIGARNRVHAVFLVFCSNGDELNKDLEVKQQNIIGREFSQQIRT